VTRQPRGRGSSKLKPVDPRKVLDGGEREHFLETAKRVSPDHYAFILMMAETGCRISEAAKLTWGDLDIDLGVARIYRQKTGGQATDVELSARLRHVLRERLTARLRESLRQGRRDGDPLQGLVFPNERGGELHLENFRRRVFNNVVKEAFPEGRPLTPHSLRHTWASLHMARGTPLKWIQDQGGWASAAMLLSVYSHFLPRETSGYSDVLSRQDRTTPNQAEAGSPGR
jgi:integrase